MGVPWKSHRNPTEISRNIMDISEGWHRNTIKKNIELPWKPHMEISWKHHRNPKEISKKHHGHLRRVP